MTNFVCSYRECIEMQKHLLGCPWAKGSTWQLYPSWWEPRDKWEDASHMVLWSYFSNTHKTKPYVQPSLAHASLCLTKHSTKWDEPLCVRGCACVCVWWSGKCHCAHWLSISALTVISLQFPHSRTNWDLPGSFSKCLKHKIDGTVCLPYIFPQLANCFFWQPGETLITEMLFSVCLLWCVSFLLLLKLRHMNID